MKKLLSCVVSLALSASLLMIGLGPASSDTGSVLVVFTKGGLIVGVGGGEGVLTLYGKHYPFTVSGMSFGATIGASTTKLVGHALNVTGPRSIEGTYSAIGAGGALQREPVAFNCKTPTA